MSKKAEALKSTSTLPQIKERVEKQKRGGLTESDLAVLAEKEKTIENGGSQQVATAHAFKDIRDFGLWKATHKSFRGYVKERWSCEKSRVGQLIKLAEIREQLRMEIPAKDKSKKEGDLEACLPLNESQIRCLLKLKKPADRTLVWMKLLESKTPQNITGTEVRKEMCTMFPDVAPVKHADKAATPELPIGDDMDERDQEKEQRETNPICFEISVVDGEASVAISNEEHDRGSGKFHACVGSYTEYECFLDAFRSAKVRQEMLQIQDMLEEQEDFNTTE